MHFWTFVSFWASYKHQKYKSWMNDWQVSNYKHILWLQTPRFCILYHGHHNSIAFEKDWKIERLYRNELYLFTNDCRKHFCAKYYIIRFLAYDEVSRTLFIDLASLLWKSWFHLSNLSFKRCCFFSFVLSMLATYCDFARMLYNHSNEGL